MLQWYCPATQSCFYIVAVAVQPSLWQLLPLSLSCQAIVKTVPVHGLVSYVRKWAMKKHFFTNAQTWHKNAQLRAAVNSAISNRFLLLGCVPTAKLKSMCGNLYIFLSSTLLPATNVKLGHRLTACELDAAKCWNEDLLTQNCIIQQQHLCSS